MAADNDETFFDGIIPDIILPIGENNRVANGTQSDVSGTKKTPKKSKTPNPDRKSTKKENLNSKKTEAKKTGRTSNTKREPLKVLNNKEKPAKVGKKENEIKNKAEVHSSLETAAGKKPQTVPKVVVFQDGSKNANGQNNKKKPVRRLTKSCDSADATGRRSLPGTGKRQTSDASRGQKLRHTISDLSSVKTQSKTNKSLTKPGENKKSPTTPKFTSLQPGFNENLSKLKTIFANTDPGFLKSQLTRFKGSLQDTLEFLLTKETELPAKPDNLKKHDAEKFQETFRENFTVEEFVTMFPDPWQHFLWTDIPKTSSYLEHSLYYLKNKYRKHYLQAIQDALTKNNNSLYLADKELSKKNRLLKMRATNRSKTECDANKPDTLDVRFLQEVAFMENEKEIKSYVKKVEIAKNKKFKEAEESESLLECLSCNNFSLLQDDAVNCPAHHVFCKDCLIKYVTIEMGKEDFRFKCLVKCEEAFPLETLQKALTPPLVAAIVGRNQTENIKPEGIENLACCPFCYHVFIAPAGTTVLKCVNPTCVMESCRKCKKGSHVPWNCGEIRVLTKICSDAEEKETEDGKREVGESEQNEKESDLFLECSEGFLEREFSDQAGRAFSATVSTVCQQNQTCNLLSRSHSPSSDSTEYAEIAGEDDHGNNLSSFS